MRIILLLFFSGLLSVLADDTEPQCGENEIVDDCPANCPNQKCPKSENQDNTCITPDPCPPPACKCRIQHRRNDEGVCIPTPDCPPFKCEDVNAVYTPCPPLCPSDSCSSKNLNGTCPYIIGIPNPCNPACRCKEGYFRNDSNKCVPKDHCP